jgi:hypothetical protein
MALGWRIAQVRVGLVPVCTIVGKAESSPRGIKGIADVVWAPAEVGTITQIARRAAFTAAEWLVFMAGCKGGILEKNLSPGTSSVGLRMSGERPGSDKGMGLASGAWRTMPIRDKIPNRAA